MTSGARRAHAASVEIIAAADRRGEHHVLRLDHTGVEIASSLDHLVEVGLVIEVVGLLGMEGEDCVRRELGKSSPRAASGRQNGRPPSTQRGLALLFGRRRDARFGER